MGLMADKLSDLDAWAFADTTCWITISLSDDSSASEIADLRTPTHAVAFGEQDSPRSKRGEPIQVSVKIMKRKSRAPKRSPPTYISADPTDFRRMVQEVTGIRLGESGLPVEPPIRPEPMLAAMGRSVQPQSYLPALDTSALLLDRAGIRRPAVDGPIFDFEPFPSFPTLESWRE